MVSSVKVHPIRLSVKTNACQGSQHQRCSVTKSMLQSLKFSKCHNCVTSSLQNDDDAFLVVILLHFGPIRAWLGLLLFNSVVPNNQFFWKNGTKSLTFSRLWLFFASLQMVCCAKILWQVLTLVIPQKTIFYVPLLHPCRGHE